MQRASGGLAIEVRNRNGRTMLARLRQDGCLKARFPRVDDGWAEIVTINLSGGVAAGDRLASSIVIGSGARAIVAAQAAERFYRAMPGSPPARVRTSVSIADGAALEWLPQESILFDAAALDRRLDVEMGGNAAFLGVESLVFGRAAMGETVRSLRLLDLIRVRRGGRLILHDAVRMDGDAQALLDRRAVAAGSRAVATVVFVSPEAGATIEAVRDALAASPAQAGASAWDGMMVARIVAPDGAALRAAVARVLAVVREGRNLPRVWCC